MKNLDMREIDLSKKYSPEEFHKIFNKCPLCGKKIHDELARKHGISFRRETNFYILTCDDDENCLFVCICKNNVISFYFRLHMGNNTNILIETDRNNGEGLNLSTYYDEGHIKDKPIIISKSPIINIDNLKEMKDKYLLLI